MTFLRLPGRLVSGSTLTALCALSSAFSGILSGCDPAPMTDAGTDAGGADAGLIDTGGASDAGSDSGADAGSDAGALSDIRFLLQGRAIDLTPSGSIAVVEDPGTGEVFFYDVAAGTSALEASVGDPSRNFSTGVSSEGYLTALHGVPVEAGRWDGTAWLDLDSPFTEGCGEEIGAAWDVSADGTVVVGMAWEGCSPAAIRWTFGAGGAVTPTTLARLGTSAGSLPPANRATAISDDGTVVGGFAQTDTVDRWPALWRADGTGMLLVAPASVPMDAPGEILSVSADGSVLAGTQNNDAFTFSQADGYVVLGRLPTSFGDDRAYPNAIARDGALIFGACGGFAFTEAFVWTEAGGMRPLSEILTAEGIDLPPGYTLRNVIAASADGTILLGTSATASDTPGSFVLRLPVSAYGL
jgi:uncharacterized membrane protein